MDGIVHAFYRVYSVSIIITVAIQTKPYSVQGLIEISVTGVGKVCRPRIRVDVGEMPRI